MKDILITKVGTTYGENLSLGSNNLDDIETLAQGAICAFDGNGLSIDSTSSVPTIHGNFVDIFANLSLTDAGLKGVRIPRSATSEFSYSKQAKTSAVTTITMIGNDKDSGAGTATTGMVTWLDASTTWVEGDEIGIMVTDTSKDIHDNRRTVRYTTSVLASEAGTMSAAIAAAILTRIVAAVTADDDAVIVATTGGTWDPTVASDTSYLKCTDADFGKKALILPFSTAGTPENATVTNDGTESSRAYVPGFNDNTNLTQITDLEKAVNVYNGRTAFEESAVVLWNKASDAASDDYFVYTLEWYADRTNKRNNSSNPDRQTLYICIPDNDTTVATAIDNLLAAI